MIKVFGDDGEMEYREGEGDEKGEKDERKWRKIRYKIVKLSAGEGELCTRLLVIKRNPEDLTSAMVYRQLVSHWGVDHSRVCGCVGMVVVN